MFDKFCATSDGKLRSRDLIVAVLIQNLLVGERNMLEIVSSIDFRWMLLDWVWSALSVRDSHRKID